MYAMLSKDKYIQSKNYLSVHFGTRPSLKQQQFKNCVSNSLQITYFCVRSQILLKWNPFFEQQSFSKILDLFTIGTQVHRDSNHDNLSFIYLNPIRTGGVLFAIPSSKLIANLLRMGISITIPDGFSS